MFLGTKRLNKKCLQIGNNITFSSSTVSLLGITIDWKLQFNDHVKTICIKANKKACALMRLRYKFSDITVRLLATYMDTPWKANSL